MAVYRMEKSDTKDINIFIIESENNFDILMQSIVEDSTALMVVNPQGNNQSSEKKADDKSVPVKKHRFKEFIKKVQEFFKRIWEKAVGLFNKIKEKLVPFVNKIIDKYKAVGFKSGAPINVKLEGYKFIDYPEAYYYTENKGMEVVDKAYDVRHTTILGKMTKTTLNMVDSAEDADPEKVKFKIREIATDKPNVSADELYETIFRAYRSGEKEKTTIKEHVTTAYLDKLAREVNNGSTDFKRRIAQNKDYITEAGNSLKKIDSDLRQAQSSFEVMSNDDITLLNASWAKYAGMMDCYRTVYITLIACLHNEYQYLIDKWEQYNYIIEYFVRLGIIKYEKQTSQNASYIASFLDKVELV